MIFKASSAPVGALLAITLFNPSRHTCHRSDGSRPRTSFPQQTDSQSAGLVFPQNTEFHFVGFTLWVNHQQAHPCDDRAADPNDAAGLFQILTHGLLEQSSPAVRKPTPSLCEMRM